MVATALALGQVASDRANALVLKVPDHFLPVPQSTIPNTVSNLHVDFFLGALGVVVIAQILLLGFTALGRCPSAVPVTIEAALWTGFGLATYEMLRGYNAAVICSGPPTHCLVSYPSILPPLLTGLALGLLIGIVWRVCWKADERAIRRATESPAAGSVANSA
jgi:hypothetical protein